MKIELTDVIPLFKGEERDIYRLVEKIHSVIAEKLQAEYRACFDALVQDWPEVSREVAETGCLKIDKGSDKHWDQIVELSKLQQQAATLMIMVDNHVHSQEDIPF